ncbi:benzoate-CoA ligase family protein [Pelagibius sp. Alg239-R121]|uniref:benzoate-CoA ligase family protein n=1 Tax=Pelagibius sp. Alg239-R121 TaxID=2993448 RepID=UPI0024A6794F|nr:benzoate-CoA ligase family protein [Pelagibius sp. Alg239-R121]
MLGPSAHKDTFSRDHLPGLEDWPEILLDRPEFQYPEHTNAAVELTDGLVAKGLGDRVALQGNGESLTYGELTAESNRIAHVLIEEMGLEPGNRILIRSANNPRMVAAWLGATKAGAVVVNTMPMLRAGELTKIVDKAEVGFALCDRRLIEELESCAASSTYLRKVMTFDGTEERQGELEQLMVSKSAAFEAVPTGRDDVALLGFTSGSTGVPKATMHFHRDILAIADSYAASVLAPTPDDAFIGSPPLAFTFGLGGLAVFPLRFGATAILVEDGRPPKLLAAVKEHGATICFTAPTAYRVMMGEVADGRGDLSSLRLAVSAGETLPKATYDAWTDATAVPILDGIGATEMLHIFISNWPDDIRPGATGKPVPGYQAMIVDDEMKPLAAGEVGKLAVRGPTGCRYLGGDRQKSYVRDGWNLTGDAFSQDADGYFHFAARSDDMIVSSGYNIAGPEVEDALLAHADVAECAVIGAEDPDRGTIVQAHVVLREGVDGDAALVKHLQDHVKSVIAPYKYPRSIVFTDALPKTPTGKVQRFKLKANEQG